MRMMKKTVRKARVTLKMKYEVKKIRKTLIFRSLKLCLRASKELHLVQQKGQEARFIRQQAIVKRRPRSDQLANGKVGPLFFKCL